MTASGQTRKSARLNGMSVLTPTADVVGSPRYVRVVPRGDHSDQVIPLLLDQDFPLSLKDPKNLSFFPATTSRYVLGYSIVSM